MTYHSVLKILDDLMAQGYEIHLFNVDYIAMHAKTGRSMAAVRAMTAMPMRISMACFS